jgi:O-antigen/teichoic acid export membrane protein
MKPKKNLVNALLYSAENITAIVFSIVSITLIARHFGPEIYARYSMAQSVSTMFIIFATLGLEPFLLREMTANRGDSEYVTSAMGGMFMGWVVYIALIISYYLVFQNLSRDVLILSSITCATLLLKVVFVRINLQAKNNPSPIALGSMISRLVAILYLVWGAHRNLPFEVMMLYLPLQAVVLLAIMLKANSEFLSLINYKSFKLKRLILSVTEASPIFASTLLFYVYSQSDILLMSELTNDEAVGVYAAATRLIPLASFIGFAIVATFYRDMDSRLKESREALFQYVRLLLSIQIGIGLVMAMTVSLGSSLIIELLYGNEYNQSSTLLSVSCWAWIFIFPAALYSRLLIMLGMAKYELIKMIIVAPLIFALNYFVIHKEGAQGAAVVYVFSYFLVDFFIYFAFAETRIFGMTGLLAVSDVMLRPIKTIKRAVNLLNTRQPV